MWKGRTMLNIKIRELRASYNMSQVELAKALGVSKQCVSNWENDNIQPSIEMLVKLANFFHVKTDYLLGLDEKDYLYVSGLTAEQRSHVQLIINDILQSGQ